MSLRRNILKCENASCFNGRDRGFTTEPQHLNQAQENDRELPHLDRFVSASAVITNTPLRPCRASPAGGNVASYPPTPATSLAKARLGLGYEPATTTQRTVEQKGQVKTSAQSALFRTKLL